MKLTSNKSNKEQEKVVKKNEKAISTAISSKILEYKSKLDAVPIQLVPIDQSEQDRQDINQYYKSISSPSTQLLDSKFYTQIIKMNRERDKSFLKEGTTRKERITILSQLILRVTTPIVYLNHKRNIQLSNFFIIDEKEKKTKEKKEEINYKDPVIDLQLPKQLTGADIQTLREQVLDKTVDKEYDLDKEITFNLTDWEADIFSQLIRDEELKVIIDKKNKKVKIVKKQEKPSKNKVFSFLIEPHREN